MLSKYSNNSITCFSLICSLLVFLLINSIIVPETKQHAIYEPIKSELYTTDQVESCMEDTIWSLKIPKLSLEANIEDGTNEDVLENYIGHFTQTSKWDGNIGLAGHNRGFKNNFFQNIKELENGDELVYCYNGETKIYSVIDKQIIRNTDWSYLKRTTENRLTLITCVEDLPEYRLCVQAIQI